MTCAAMHLCEMLYAITNYGREFETNFYYDKFGNIVPRRLVLKKSNRILSEDYIPAYDFGECHMLATTKIRDQQHIKSKLKTALYLGVDATAEFLVQMGMQNRIKM